MFKVGFTTMENGTKVEILRIIENARKCEFTGLAQSIVGIYETDPGAFLSFIWLEDGRGNTIASAMPPGFNLVPNA